jgi:hypothetical protein
MPDRRRNLSSRRPAIGVDAIGDVDAVLLSMTSTQTISTVKTVS